MIVTGCSHGHPQQTLVIINSLNDRHQEQQKLCVFVRGFTGGEQIDAGICGNGPVIVLAAAVDTRKRLFVEQTYQIVFQGDLLHDLHGQLVMIRGNICGSENGSQLMLCRCNLVVLRLGKNTKLPQLFVQLFHVGSNSGLDGAEIVVIQLLTLGRFGAEQGSAGKDQVLTLVIHGFVDEEILLFRTDRGGHMLDIAVSEELQNTQRLLVQCFHRTQQRCFLVQCFAAVGTEGGGDAQSFALDKSVAGGVPSGVASCFKGCPQTAGRERGGIRFTFNQFFPGEFHNHSAVWCGRNKTVMLFSSNTGQRLEPVGKVGCAICYCPISHGYGHSIGYRRVQFLARVNGLFQ